MAISFLNPQDSCCHLIGLFIIMWSCGLSGTLVYFPKPASFHLAMIKLLSYKGSPGDGSGF